MSEDVKKLFDERLGRYQAAIALEPTDRIPIASGSNYFAEVYSGNTNQETLYDSEKWLKAELAFCKAFPEVDVLEKQPHLGAPLRHRGSEDLQAAGPGSAAARPVSVCRTGIYDGRRV